MRLVLPAHSHWPLYGVASSRALERAALSGLPPHTLMERAGLSAARLCLALASGERRFNLLCGPGNNGGDGLVAARLLHTAGAQVQVSLVGHDANKPLAPDAQAALQAAQQAGVPISPELPSSKRACLTVDALLGLGLNRAPAPELLAAIELLNASTRPVLALDLPSGLLADTGSLAGPSAVRAQYTLSFLTLKPGLFTGQGRAHSGQVWFDDLQAPQVWAQTLTSKPAPDALLLGRQAMQEELGLATWANHNKHKGNQGDVLLIGGAAGMQGAIRLAASAALACGAGRVYLCALTPDPTATGEADVARPELIRFALQGLQDPRGWRDKVLVCGCGGGAEIQHWLPSLLTHARRLVLDADGLNALAQSEHLQALMRERAEQGRHSVLTPHPLEAARLLNCSSAEVQADRLSAAHRLAERFKATVLLKGSGSIIVEPCPAEERDGKAFTAINSSGNAALATAGSGDVLAGWLGGLWAQQAHIPTGRLAAAACYWHGLAAETQTAGPLRAAELIERMHALHPLTLAAKPGP